MLVPDRRVAALRDIIGVENGATEVTTNGNGAAGWLSLEEEVERYLYQFD